MPAYLNRLTLTYRKSVSEPEITDPENWIKDPDLSAVVDLPSRYWKLTGDVVSAMTQPERDAVDAALLVASRNEAVAQLQKQEDILRAFMLIVLDEFTLVANRMNALLTAIDNAGSLAALKTAAASIADIPVRTEKQLRTAIRNRLGS